MTICFLLHIIDISKTLKNKLKNALNIDGLTLVQNNGDVQEIKHFHIHLKPHYKENLNLDIEKVYELLS